MSTSTLPPSLFNSILWNQGAFGGSAAGLVGQSVGGLIYAALRKAGVTLGPGRTPSPAQMQDGIDELRRLTGSLNCDRLFIYALDTYLFPIVESKRQYTIGDDISADFVAPRPQLLEQAYQVNGDARDCITVVNAPNWGDRVSWNGAWPFAVYNDRAHPVSTLHFSGLLSAGNTLELWIWHQVPTYTSDSDAVILPTQYEDALVLNLACRLAPHFQREVHPDVRQQARESLMHLRSINAPQPIADLSWGPGSWNWYDDYGAGPIVSGGTGGAAVPGPPGPPGPAGAAGPGALGITIDGGGSAITPGVKGYLSAPFAGTITGWDAVADQVGSITIEVAKKAGGVPNVITDKISASSPVALSSAQIALNGSIAGWTTSVSVDDVIGFNVTAASTLTRLTVTIQITKI